MTEQSDNASYGQPDAPDANQQKNEQVSESPETSAQAGDSAQKAPPSLAIELRSGMWKICHL